jgi:SAM-dependent methyltransferase
VKNRVMEKIADSRHWQILWKTYSFAPSVALCRVPEIEYASTLDVDCRVLDHCCGDGLFASLAWPGKQLSAGCDIHDGSVELARRSPIYKRVYVCDASKQLPYADRAFDLVFNNSGLEHISDLDAVLAEIARVLRAGGTLAFNVLNHRYFEWWPLDERSMNGYRNWQPFFHALSCQEWTDRLLRAGLKIVGVEGYLDRQASRDLALLDCRFSGVHIAHRRSLLVSAYRLCPRVMKTYWHRRLSALIWKTPAEQGAGYFIKAVRLHG